jgi:hypothetical protein
VPDGGIVVRLLRGALPNAAPFFHDQESVTKTGQSFHIFVDDEDGKPLGL